MSEKDSQGVVYTKENNYYIVGTNAKDNNNAESTSSSIIFPSHFKRIPVKAIGIYAFRNSSTLKSIFIQYTIEEIRDDALSYTRSLESIHFADNSRLKELGHGAFFLSSIKSIALPNKVKIFKYNCFGYTKIESILFCGIPKTINESIFGKKSGNFLAFPEHFHVNNMFPFDKFGDFSEITNTNSCDINKKTCYMSKRSYSFFICFVLFICK